MGLFMFLGKTHGFSQFSPVVILFWKMTGQNPKRFWQNAGGISWDFL